MMKKFRNLFKTCIVVGTLALSTNIFMPLGSDAAGNIKDEKFDYTYIGDGCDHTVPVSRAKLDYTSCYVKNTSSFAIRINVLSTNRSGRSFTVLENSSVTPYLRVPAGHSKYIPNYVREHGYHSCTLGINPEIHKRAKVRGVWSPDSV
ncbi:hypothetical protein SAMN05216249_12819 [Acetitomaculum ruminis DSM 5522]|uniref:Uncharacterized protein n=1 Tax=Acetitomaculum ruminis DSM 5522 TaxID=1120918 RepID=A0A1I1AJW4_9FIRM|nr:DUF2712 domain-containing protein [Acetitomaculum ruminis]SFB37782.1 hypothetical protein SAMN05216249_12819 [Acetitomaculum ruminis DSM 5522]